MTVTAQPTKGNFFPAVLLVLGGLLLLFGSGGTVFEIFPPKPDANRWFILVDQFEDRDNPKLKDYVDFINNQEFRKSIAEKQINFRSWDADQAEGRTLAVTTKLDVPFYAVATPTQSDGKTELKVVDSGPAPTSVDGANSIIKKWIGK